MSERSSRYTVRALMILALTTVITVFPSASAAASPSPVPHVTTVLSPQPSADRATAAARPNRGSAARPALHPEFVAAHSKAAKDLHGALPSLYHGPYYHKDQESFRLCVAEREGMFTYNVRGGGGNNYFGTYQMSAALIRGAAWMMASESRQTHDGLYSEARALVNVPGDKWSRYWSDRAFYRVLNAHGKWSGKAHWAGGRWHC